MATLKGTKFVEAGKEGPDVNFTARACASTYAIMCGFLTLMFLLVLYSHQAKGAWQMLVMLGSILVFILLWVGSFRISVAGNTVSYRSLLGGTRSLQSSEIEKAEIKIDRTEKFGPVYRLILWPESFALKKPIVINMKVFSKADLTRLFDFLGPKLHSKRRFSIFSTE